MDGETMQGLIAGVLRLEPLTVDHASEMFDVLSDPGLYDYLDYGPPPSREHVRDVYARLETRRSPDGLQRWLNWVIRTSSGRLIGYVQATLLPSNRAWIAYLLASAHQRSGHARVATRAMIEHLRLRYRIEDCLAIVEAAHERSIALLEALAFRRGTAPEAAEHELTASERLYVLRGPMP